MAKIILNGRFGGYGWSYPALIEILERKNDVEVIRYFDHIGEHPNTKDVEVSKEEFLASKSWGKHIEYRNVNRRSWVYISANDFEEKLREDPDAIAVLEERGKEYCSGDTSSLYVDEYDENLFSPYVSEYDGMESLTLIPKLSEERIRSCKDVDEIVELLRNMDLFGRSAT